MLVDSYSRKVLKPWLSLWLGKENANSFVEAGLELNNRLWDMRAIAFGALLRGLSPSKRPYVQIVFNRRCNIQCPNCGVPSTAENEMSVDHWKDILTKIDEAYRPRHLGISGGEPLLRKAELLEIISFATNRGITTGLNTNGLRLYEDTARALRDAGLTTLTVSYDGIPPKNVPVVLDRAQEASGLGIPTTVQLTLSERNIGVARSIKEDVFRRHMSFSAPLVQTVNGLFSTDIYQPPSVEDVRRFYGELLDDQRSLFEVRVRDDRNWLKFMATRYPEKWKCSGTGWVTIDEGGRMMHCQEYSTPYGVDDALGARETEFELKRRELADACEGCQFTCYYTADEQGRNLLPISPIKLEVQGWQRMAAYTLDTILEKLGGDEETSVVE
ncbi:MAG: radical SAM protein [Candidatus Woesearchaeota archaeon]